MVLRLGVYISPILCMYVAARAKRVHGISTMAGIFHNFSLVE